MVVGIGVAKALIGIQSAHGWPQWNCLNEIVWGLGGRNALESMGAGRTEVSRS